jgi:hypothetical protein
MPGHSQERRKTLVINKPLQGKMILGMALTPSLALAAIAVLTAVWCTRTMENAALEEAELPNLTPIFYVVVAFELVAAVYLMVNSLKISHRVAGPAYRICKSLERIRSGDLAFTVNLRKGDHLTEVRDQLNLLLDWLNENPPKGCTTRKQAASTATSTAGITAANTQHETELEQLAHEAITAATTAAAEAELSIQPTKPGDDDSA